MFDAVAFAGGGNRCYWQGGFWEAAAPLVGIRPKMVIGVSAGAWSACYSLLGLGRRVNEMVAQGCSLGRRNFEWRAWRSEGSPWPVSLMYRSLIENFVDESTLQRLKQGPDVLIGLARKPRRLPLSLAVPLGLATYQIEKTWRSPVHPRGGRALGFRPEFVRVQDLASPEDLLAAFMASASVPPFMPVGRVGGMAALDGGLVDNVPIEPLLPVEAQGGKTLVILSRLYCAFPKVSGRTYVQPSEPVPIGQFDITNPAGIRKAYEMGLKDGEAFARRIRMQTSP
ncbi:patatin-like phospholipase family protein [Microvirga aerilata]|uniref:Patatin-like phospholipase family protein n=1 Tax=Microvirga aerilata TaxID=670292 RepID=A0A936Z968_9HYPH|nr:patatin-like phospholipase family protein [Microvirga aerilata]MBL0405097.1 patatin-like phospholipase family protein [Microvirga aerilata]